MANDHRSMPGLSSGHGAATSGPVGRDPVPLATVRPWDQGRVCLGGQGRGRGLRGVPVPDEMEPTNGDGVALSLVTSGRDEGVSEFRGEAYGGGLVQGQVLRQRVEGRVNGLGNCEEDDGVAGGRCGCGGLNPRGDGR